MRQTHCRGRRTMVLTGLALLVGGLAGGRPAAAELTVVDPIVAIDSVEGIEPAGEAMHIVAPRGGFGSGAVVGDAAPVSTEVSVAPLVGPGGARIDAANVRLRYAGKPEVRHGLVENMEDRARGFASEWSVRYTNQPYYDVLHPTPPANQRRTPIWLTVQVPADAAPGRYRGELRVGEQTVPIRLEVGRFACPPPAEWVHHAGFDVSLELLWRTFGVEEWSEPHWRAIDRTLGLLGGLGCDDVHLPLYVGENHLGATRPILRFERDAAGELVPRLEEAERYLRMFAERVGQPTNVILDVWDPILADRPRPPRPPRTTLPVLVRDGGGWQPVEVPAPAHDGSRAWCAAVLTELYEVVDRLGWPREVVKLGYASDRRPDRDAVRMFEEIAPDASWAIFTHGRGDPPPPTDADQPWLIDGLRIGQYVHVYVSAHLGAQPADVDWPEGVRGGWTISRNIPTSARLWLYDYVPRRQFRGFANGVVGQLGKVQDNPHYRSPAGGSRGAATGFVHVGFNFWELPEGEGPRAQRGKRPQWANMFRSGVNTLTAPAPPDGSVPGDGSGDADGLARARILATTRYELFREGQQELEARFVIERGLLSGQLDADLAQRCVQALQTLNRTRARDGELFDGHETYIQMDYRACLYGFPDGWREDYAELLDVAGAVQAAMDGQ